MKTGVRILIADDHPIVRQGLRHVIEDEARLTIVGEVSDGRAALDQIERLRPDVVLLDIDMPGLDGFGVAREIEARRLPVAIIFLTVYREERFFREAVQLGARGYVLKDSAATDIVSSIHAVVAGAHYTSPALTSYLVTRQKQGAAAPGAHALDALTPTERRVLALIADYKTSRDIGEVLHISHRTVQTHRTNICLKLDLHGNHALMKFALDHKAEL